MEKEYKKTSKKKSTYQLKLYFCNVHGTRSNFSSIESFLLQLSLDIFKLVEINLNSYIATNRLSVPG